MKVHRNEMVQLHKNIFPGITRSSRQIGNAQFLRSDCLHPECDHVLMKFFYLMKQIFNYYLYSNLLKYLIYFIINKFNLHRGSNSQPVNYKFNTLSTYSLKGVYSFFRIKKHGKGCCYWLYSTELKFYICIYIYCIHLYIFFKILFFWTRIYIFFNYK